MSLIAWSWIFLLIYIAVMLTLGVVAKSKVQHADDFATARGSYGPYFLRIGVCRFGGERLHVSR